MEAFLLAQPQRQNQLLQILVLSLVPPNRGGRLRRHMIELRFTVFAPKRIEPVQLFLCLLGLPERIGGVFVVVADAHVDASGS